jgi:hypothetical protein
LSKGGATALALAFDCRIEAKAIAAETRAKLQQLLTKAPDLPISNPKRKPLVAAIVGLWLRESIQLSSGPRLCATPATREIFQLFLKENPIHNNVATYLASGSELDLPVLGVRGSDAIAFSAWVTRTMSDGRAYRLPTDEETSDIAFLRREWSVKYAVWTTSPQLHPSTSEPVRPRLWVPAPMANPLRAAPEIIYSAVLGDLARVPISLLIEISLIVSIYDTRLFYVGPSPALSSAFDRRGEQTEIQPLIRALRLALSDFRDPLRARTRVTDTAKERDIDLAEPAKLEKALRNDIAIAESAQSLRDPSSIVDSKRKLMGLLGEVIERRLTSNIPEENDLEDLAARVVTLDGKLKLHSDSVSEYLTQTTNLAIAERFLLRTATLSSGDAQALRLVGLKYFFSSPWLASSEVDVAAIAIRLIEAATALERRSLNIVLAVESIAIIRQ